MEKELVLSLVAYLFFSFSFLFFYEALLYLHMQWKNWMEKALLFISWGFWIKWLTYWVSWLPTDGVRKPKKCIHSYRNLFYEGYSKQCCFCKSFCTWNININIISQFYFLYNKEPQPQKGFQNVLQRLI